MAATGWMTMITTLLLVRSAQMFPLEIQSAAGPVTPDQLRKELEFAATLPLHSQKILFKQLGESFLKSQNEAGCNIFAGKNSCVESSGNLPFHDLCGSSNKTVDCAFRVPPNLNPREKLEKSGFTGCGECMTAVQQFWCSQAAPPCGSFDYVVDELLPLVSTVSTRKASALSALKASVPRIFQAASLGLPCKRMCNAITNTCSCGETHRFGEVMTELAKGDNSASSISLATAQEIFSGIWNKPVCELFADESTPGFSGVCEHVQDTSKCDWCKTGAPRSLSAFHEQAVLQMTQMFYGIMKDGLQPFLKAAAAGKGSLQDNWNMDLSSGEVSQARHVGVVVVLLLLLFLAVGGFFVAMSIHKHREVPSQYIDLHSMGYNPPML